MWRIVDNTEDFKILFLSNYHFLLNLENLTFLDLGGGNPQILRCCLSKYFHMLIGGGGIASRVGYLPCMQKILAPSIIQR